MRREKRLGAESDWVAAGKAINNSESYRNVELCETHNESDGLELRISYCGFRSLESLILSIWLLLPAARLVIRIVDIWTRKDHAILSQRFVSHARKVESLSRSEVGP